MNTLMSETLNAWALSVRVTEDALSVDLADGRTVVVPLAWYPRLLNAKRQERNHWRFIGGGVGIHWPALDEDISVEGLLAGRPSGESHRSLQCWLDSRKPIQPNLRIQPTRKQTHTADA